MGKHKDKKLTPKEQEFVRLVILTQNQSEAYRQAFRYKGKHADSEASKLAVKPSIKAEIDRLRAEIIQEFDVSLKALVQVVAAIVHFDHAKVMSWGPGGIVMKEDDEIDPRYRKAIQSLGEHRSEDGEISFSVKGHDKLRGVELLCKMLGHMKDAGKKDGEGTKAVLERLNKYMVKHRGTIGS